MVRFLASFASSPEHSYQSRRLFVFARCCFGPVAQMPSRKGRLNDYESFVGHFSLSRLIRLLNPGIRPFHPSFLPVKRFGRHGTRPCFSLPMPRLRRGIEPPGTVIIASVQIPFRTRSKHEFVIQIERTVLQNSFHVTSARRNRTSGDYERPSTGDR